MYLTMSKQLLFLLIAGFALSSCSSSEQDNQQPATEQSATNTPDSSTPYQAAKDNISLVKLDTDKDPVCGMPVKNHLTDTTQYKGKVYGFCAKECKEEFLTNPESFLTQQ